MKLVIPPVIQIGPLKYSVVFSNKLMDKLSDRSSVNVKEQIIRLQDETSNEQLFANFIHEVDHVAEDTVGIETNEQNTVGRANLMAHALLSMGIDPDFSKIPQEVIQIVSKE